MWGSEAAHARRAAGLTLDLNPGDPEAANPNHPAPSGVREPTPPLHALRLWPCLPRDPLPPPRSHPLRGVLPAWPPSPTPFWLGPRGGPRRAPPHPHCLTEQTPGARTDPACGRDRTAQSHSLLRRNPPAPGFGALATPPRPPLLGPLSNYQPCPVWPCPLGRPGPAPAGCCPAPSLAWPPVWLDPKPTPVSPQLRGRGAMGGRVLRAAGQQQQAGERLEGGQRGRRPVEAAAGGTARGG